MLIGTKQAKPVIVANNLEFRFRPETTPLFAGISLAVEPQEIVCLLGGSGCGKSTLLRTLAGLHKAGKSSIEFLGQALDAPHPRAAMVFQQPSLLPWLNVSANVRFGLNFKHQPRLARAVAEKRIRDAIAAVGLQGKERLYPSQLSGGMAQRVALARALAREPALLFADEPFSALDAITRTEMQALLLKLVRQWRSAVLLVTHDIDEAIAIADRILLMGDKPARIVREWHVPRNADAGTAQSDLLRVDILHALQDLLTTASSNPLTEATT
jgi:NitT/TauT family transport system ATP-binding protein